jgi:hypothetical protein
MKLSKITLKYFQITNSIKSYRMDSSLHVLCENSQVTLGKQFKVYQTKTKSQE